MRFQQKTPLAWLDTTIVNMALYWLGHFHPITCEESKYWSQCDSGVHLGPKTVLLTTHLTHVRRVIFNPFPALGQNDVPILYLSLLNPSNSGGRFDGEVKAVIWYSLWAIEHRPSSAFRVCTGFLVICCRTPLISKTVYHPIMML